MESHHLSQTMQQCDTNVWFHSGKTRWGIIGTGTTTPHTLSKVFDPSAAELSFRVS